jgi:hypothetical protein
MMIALLISMAAANEPIPATTPTARKEPTRYCREMINASSRLHSVKVCRTRAEWRRWEACHGSVTRYCTPKKYGPATLASLGRGTAFALGDDSRIVCRMVFATGSRIAKEQLCLPKREWERLWKESAEGTLKLQDRSTRGRGVQ